MNKIIGVILILVGGFLLYKGATRSDSVAGELDEAGSKLANRIDGGSRIPEHYYYLAGGGILAAIGIAMAVSGRRSS